ncbi:MAG: hypothetical protein PUA61_03950 [Succinatimonas hippei]|nr:hypothetical protein [Succinatimonas hippei]
MFFLHRKPGFYGTSEQYREELKILSDCEIERRRAIIARKIRIALKLPEVLKAWSSLREWREYAREHPYLAEKLERFESEFNDLDDEIKRRKQIKDILL